MVSYGIFSFSVLNISSWYHSSVITRLLLVISLSLRSNGHFPAKPGLASFIAAKDDGSGGGDNWSYKTWKAPVKLSPNISTPYSLQAGYPSCRPTNSVEALKSNLHM